MAKKQTFESTSRKLDKIFQIQETSEFEINNQTIDLDNPILYASRIKQPQILFDSGWIDHASGETFALTNFNFNDPTLDQVNEGFPWPVEFRIEKDLDIKERFLPFVKVQLFVKSSQVYNPVAMVLGGKNLTSIDNSEFDFMQIKGDSIVLYKGPQNEETFITQDKLDTGRIEALYVTNKINLRESDDSFKASLLEVEVVDIDQEPYPGDLIEAPGDTGPIVEDKRTIMKGFTSNTTTTVTGRGVQRHETWSETGNEVDGKTEMEKSVVHTCETKTGDVNNPDHIFTFSGGQSFSSGDKLVDDNGREAWYTDCYITPIRASSLGIPNSQQPIRDDYPHLGQLPYDLINFQFITEEVQPNIPSQPHSFVDFPFPNQQHGWMWLRLSQDKFRLYGRGQLFFSRSATEPTTFNTGREAEYSPSGTGATYLEDFNNSGVREVTRYSPADFNAQLRILVTLLPPFTWQENRKYIKQ